MKSHGLGVFLGEDLTTYSVTATDRQFPLEQVLAF